MSTYIVAPKFLWFFTFLQFIKSLQQFYFNMQHPRALSPQNVIFLVFTSTLDVSDPPTFW